MHWTCVVAFMQEKRIQYYDAMQGDGMAYLKVLFQYLQDEHLDKKKKALPNAHQWTLVRCTADTPRQQNGFDCGVFTCMYADFLSQNCPLIFDQSHMPQCREHIALSIMAGNEIQ
jgi:sentrin-specific protease 1